MKKLILGVFGLMLTGLSLSALADGEAAVQDVGNAVGNTAQDVGNAVSDAAHGTANAVTSATQENDPPATNILQQVGQTISDVAITTSIYAKYAADPLVNPLQINVETNNGEVTLTGNVDANAEFEQAIQIAANTQGVKDVNAKGLTVTPSQQFFTDAYITSEVKFSLLRNQYVDGADFSTWNIHIETNNGVVYLIGKVKDEVIKAKIIAVAKSVKNVKDVKADLTIEQ